MYEQYFGFNGRPFPAMPADWQLFTSEFLSSVIPGVVHTLRGDSGVAVVTGPGGVGKTVLLHHLSQTMQREGQAVVLPGTSLATTDDLHAGIGRHLNRLPEASGESDAGRWGIVDRLQKSAEFWGPLTILIDDAHLMPVDLFSELRFLLEQRLTSGAACRLLLAGALQLEETLAQPSLAGFAQRIRTFCFLEPLRMRDSVAYLTHQLKVVGGSLGKLFDAQSVEFVVEAADGNPRCLNLLVDECLILAARSEKKQVTDDIVNQAFDRLQHLPHAWNISPRRESQQDVPVSPTSDRTVETGTVEFGGDGIIEVGAPQTAAPVSSQGTHCPDVGVVEIGGPDVGGAPIGGPPLEHVIETAVAVEEFDLAADDAEPLESDQSPEIHDWINDRESALADLDFSDDDVFEAEDFDAGVGGATDAFEFDEAEFDLSELEPVGDPAIDIDRDLDCRLLMAARSTGDIEASSRGTASEETTADLQDMLTEIPVWQPAGNWPRRFERASETIARFLPMAGNSDDNDDAATIDLPTVSEECGSIGYYKLVIPPPEDAPAVWPPETDGISPSVPVEILQLPESADEQSYVFGLTSSIKDTSSDHNNVVELPASARAIPEELHQPRRTGSPFPATQRGRISAQRGPVAGSTTGLPDADPVPARLSVPGLLPRARQALAADPPATLKSAAGAESVIFSVPLSDTSPTSSDASDVPRLRAYTDESEAVGENIRAEDGSTAEAPKTAAERESALRTLFTRLRNAKR